MKRYLVTLLLVPAAVYASSSVSAPVPAPAPECEQFYESKNFGAARTACTAAADKGNAQARYVLGRMYEKGDGVKKDEATAVKWYKLAAEGGHATAQRRLAGAYALGRGVAKDQKLGMYWIQQAAKNGDTRAQKQLAKGYEMGLFGLPKDEKLANEWRERARQGDSQKK